MKLGWVLLGMGIALIVYGSTKEQATEAALPAKRKVTFEVAAAKPVETPHVEAVAKEDAS